MTTQQQLDDAATQLINVGIAAAEDQAGFIEKQMIEQTKSSLLAQLPKVESVLGEWFRYMHVKYGWKLTDASDSPVWPKTT